jgi:hypothetical protein
MLETRDRGPGAEEDLTGDGAVMIGVVVLFLIGALLFLAGAVAGAHIVLGGEPAQPTPAALRQGAPPYTSPLRRRVDQLLDCAAFKGSGDVSQAQWDECLGIPYMPPVEEAHPVTRLEPRK